MNRIIKIAARLTLGALPPPALRLNGPLALHRGKPVRDTRLRPWVGNQNNGLADWLGGVSTSFRRVFISGVEGLPQTKQKEMARLLRKKWRPPPPIEIETSESYIHASPSLKEKGLRLLEHMFRRILRLTGASRLLRVHPAEYNLFVTMRKK